MPSIQTREYRCGVRGRTHRREIDRFVATRETLDDLLDSEALEAVYVQRLSELGERAVDIHSLIQRLLNNGIAFASALDGISLMQPSQRVRAG